MVDIYIYIYIYLKKNICCKIELIMPKVWKVKNFNKILGTV